MKTLNRYIKYISRGFELIEPLVAFFGTMLVIGLSVAAFASGNIVLGLLLAALATLTGLYFIGWANDNLH